MAGYDEYLRSTGTIRLVGFLLASLAFVPAIAFGALGDSGRFAGGVAVGATVVGSLSLVALIGLPSDGDGSDDEAIGTARKAAMSGR